jgi:hypothetical protein
MVGSLKLSPIQCRARQNVLIRRHENRVKRPAFTETATQENKERERK